MSDAPERIWAWPRLEWTTDAGTWSSIELPRSTQYTREDVVDARVHAAHRAGYDAARADAAKSGWHLLNYDDFMRGGAKP